MPTSFLDSMALASWVQLWRDSLRFIESVDFVDGSEDGVEGRIWAETVVASAKLTTTASAVAVFCMGWIPPPCIPCLSKGDADDGPAGSAGRCDIFRRMLVAAHRRRPLAYLLGLLVFVAAGLTRPAAGQDGFRVTFEADRTRPDRARLTGRVFNDRTED